MPESSDEFLSSRPQNFSKSLQAQLKNFTQRLQMARTLIALTVVRRDIEQSSVQQNASAKEQLRAFANTRARELGYKGTGGGSNWWN